MKRFLAGILSLLFMFSLASCAQPGEGKPSGTEGSATTAYESSPATGAPATSTVASENAIKYEDGLYVQYTPPQKTDGAFSTFQTNAVYSDAYRLNSDSVMVYVSNIAQLDSRFESWSKLSDEYRIDMMIAVNRDNSEWVARDPENNSKSIQASAGGSYICHSTSKTNYYMVPTLAWTEYVLELVTEAVTKYSPSVIVFEEPEMWHASGYSEGFKEEWKAYYGTDWADPVSSPEAGFMSMRLKTYLFERILTTLSQRVKQLSPDTKVYIATHSTVNYSAWGITAGLNSYMALGVLDGVIGQTWSDTAYSSVFFRGTSISDAFLSGFAEYASYPDSVAGCDFYALSDPLADNTSFSQELCRKIYRHTLTASLMQPEIERFQLFPWPERSFVAVSGEYRTVQCSVFSALDRLASRESELTAGTPGIYFGISDSLSWQIDDKKWSLNTARSFNGMTLPLIDAGIPLKMKSLESVRTAEDLKDVKVLILSYDCQKPLSEAVNTAIAQWVKDGGSLLYLGGHDKYEKVANQWWSDSGLTPLEDLIARLGANLTVTTPTGLDCRLKDADGKEIEYTFALDMIYGGFYAGFTGDGKTDLLYAQDNVIACEVTSGKGNVIFCGLPSAYYSTADASTEVFLSLVRRAVFNAGLEWSVTPVMTMRRGDIVAAHAAEAGEHVNGKYIDIFDSHLPVVTDPAIPEDDSLLLFDLSAVSTDIPRLAFTGGEIISLDEKKDSTEFTLRGPANTLLSSRLTSAEGSLPVSVTASEGDLWCVWDAASATLFVQSMHGAKVSVLWGDTLGVPTEFPDIHELFVKTSSQGADAEYIYSNTAYANDTLRFCDLNGELVYRFDLAGKENFSITLTILQNYILEYSADGENFTVIADYSLEHPEHLQDGRNITDIKVEPAALGVSDTLYIRLRNTDVTQGWGGSITHFTLRWGEPVRR